METPKSVNQIPTSLAQGVINQTMDKTRDRTPMSTCYDCNNTYRTADGEVDPRSKTIDYILFKSFLPHKVIFFLSTLC